MSGSTLISECVLYNFIFQLLKAGSSEDEASELDTNIDDNMIEFIGDTLPALFAKMQTFSHQDES